MKTVILAFLAICAPVLAQPQEYNGTPARRGTAASTDRIIVKWRDGTESSIASATTRKVAAGPGLVVEGKQTISTGLEVLHFNREMEASELASVLAAFELQPQIEYASADLRRHIHALPADPLIADQWYLLSTQPAATRAEQAWDVTVGSVATIVAVLDTGVRFEHPDLGRTSQGGKLLPGFDFVSNVSVANDGDGRDADASDPGDWVTSADLQQAGLGDCEVGNSSWHGTRVAGLIGAHTNNAIGVAGAGWNTLILPVRVLGKCGGFDSDIIAGMRWAAGFNVSGAPPNLTHARIVNLSLGGEGACSSAYQSTIDELSEAGVLVVASVGNEGGSVSAPANCVGALGVTGLRHVGTKVGFSNVGASVGLGAPGGNCVNTGLGQPCLFSLVVATNFGAQTPAGSGYTDAINFNVGTSFSAPLVAGAAALMHSVNSRLGPAQFISLLKETATPFPISADPAVPGCRVPASASDLQTSECSCSAQTCGSGMLNTGAAVLAAQRPFAVARALNTVVPGALVPIDASASFASNNRNIVSVQWSVLNANGVVPTILAPAQMKTTLQVAGSSQFTLRLTVLDDHGIEDSADVAIATSRVTSVPQRSSSGGGGGQIDWQMILILVSWMGLRARRRTQNA
jgi:serine protease